MRSMTGYAKETFENDLFKMSIEMKSVNNKNLNLRVKLPYILNFIEHKIRTTMSNKILRGSIDLRIDFEDKRENENMYEYNSSSAKAVLKTINEMEEDLGITFEDKIEAVLKYGNGNILTKAELDIDENLYENFVIKNLVKVVSSLNRMKEEEGLRLRDYFESRVRIIKGYLSEIEILKENVTLDYKEKLLNRLNSIQNDINFDEQDILKEILIFADRSDISEETSRLKLHLDALEELFVDESKIDKGKKLDFLLQESFRELNTMGVKSNYYSISKLVVEAKTEVEKLREQGMNVE
jgi:uncharacterized protein (TIGR00255 family)